jgi:hypothetical protein
MLVLLGCSHFGNLLAHVVIVVAFALAQHRAETNLPPVPGAHTAGFWGVVSYI